MQDFPGGKEYGVDRIDHQQFIVPDDHQQERTGQSRQGHPAYADDTAQEDHDHVVRSRQIVQHGHRYTYEEPDKHHPHGAPAPGVEFFDQEKQAAEHHPEKHGPYLYAVVVHQIIDQQRNGKEAGDRPSEDTQ